MKPSKLFLLAFSAITSTAQATIASSEQRRIGAGEDNAASRRPKVIMDNDWTSTTFIEFLVVLNAGWELLGLTSSTSDTWALQSALHALATLEVGNLSCIPVYRGSNYPLINHPGVFHAWEAVHGELVWQGAFAPMNETLEAEGSDPTGGDPERVVRGAFVEGFPNATLQSLSAAEFMVQQVRKYPGEISIYAAGALTNVALAVRLDPSFARNCKQLMVMGGYVDDNLHQATGSLFEANNFGDINLMIDPEGAKIALTADFPNITLTANAVNQVMTTSEVWAGIDNSYTVLLNKYYDTQWPFWDETVAALMVDPSLMTNVTSFYVDVDTSYGSPSYGNIHAYQKVLAPRAQKLQKVNYPLKVDADGVKQVLRNSLKTPPTCADLSRLYI